MKCRFVPYEGVLGPVPFAWAQAIALACQLHLCIFYLQDVRSAAFLLNTV